MDSQQKSARKSAPGRPFAKGGDSRQGRGPAPGTGGRTPDAFKQEMRRLVSRADVLRKLGDVLNDPDHPQWMAAYKFAAEQGYGKAAQPIVGDGDSPLRMIVEYVDPPDADG